MSTVSLWWLVTWEFLISHLCSWRRRTCLRDGDTNSCLFHLALNSTVSEARTFQFSSVQFSLSEVSDSLRPHEPQHARPPSPSPTLGVHPNPCPLCQWCHPTISCSVVPVSLLPSIFPSIRDFSSESAFHITWPKYWSFSFDISPSSEHPGLIFRMDWLDLLAVQGTLKSLLQHHSSKASILQHSAFFIVQLSHSYFWKNHSLN